MRLQLQCSKNPLYKGTFDCFRTIVKKESLSGLYKGVTSPLYSLALINAIVFGVQGNALRRMSNPDSVWSHFKAGAVAGFVQCGICGPMELIKTRMQMQGLGEKRGSKVMYKGSIDCLKKIYHIEGVKGLTRGLSFTAIREIPAFGMYFASYEWLCRQLTPEDMDHTPTIGLLVAGGLAGCCSWISSYPVDVVKSRIQADGVYKDGKFHYKYSGYRDCIRQSVAEEGPLVLFRGLNSTLIRAFPTNAATLTVVTWCLRYMRPDESYQDREETIERATMIAQLEG